MMAFGAKIKLSVNTSGASAFRSEIQKYVNTATASNPIKLKNFSVSITKDQQRKIIRDIQAYLSSDNNALTLKIGKIDATGAVNKLRQQLQTMLSGLSITGLKEFLGETNIDKITEDIDNAKRAASQWAAQMRVVDDISKRLGSTYKTALSGGQMLGDATQVSEITAEYTAWQAKVEELRNTKIALSAEEIQNLQQEGIAIQQKISLIQEEQAATARASTEAERAAAREEIAARKQISLAQQQISLKAQVQRYILSNSKAYKAYGNELDGIMQLLRSESSLTNEELKQIRMRFYEIQRSAQAAGKSGNTFFDTLKKGWEKFGGWSLVTKSMMAVIRLFKEMISSTKELDAAMTELKKVTDLTDASYAKFLTTATTISKSIGASLADTVNATADFARLGYTVTEATSLAEAALVYKNVGDGIDDISIATESLISTIKAFGIEAEDALSIVDRFNEVGNRFAISSEGIGTALQKSASALAAANNSLEESIALVTGMNAVIQNPEVVGTALKTVSMYLRAAKTEAEEAGEATDGMANSVSELRAELLTLTNGKVDIMLDDNSFKSTYQIMKELSEVWSELSDIDAANILELIGGKRNATAITSLLTNFEDAEKSLATASDAAGSAMAENEKYLDSIAGKVDQFTASFEAMSANVVDSSVVKWVVELGTGLVNLINALQQIHLLLPLIAASIATIKYYQMYQQAQETATQINVLVNRFVAEKTATDSLAASYWALTKAQQQEILIKLQEKVASNAITQSDYKEITAKLGLATATTGAKVATDGLNVSIKALLLSNPIGWIITAISIIPMLVSWISSLHKSNEELIEDAKNLKEEYSQALEAMSGDLTTLKGLRDEFAVLSKGVDDYGNNISLTTDEYERYKEIVQTILGISPELISGYDAEGNAIANKNGLLQKSIDLLEEEQRLKKAEMVTDDKLWTMAKGSIAEYKEIVKKIDDVAMPNTIAWSGVQIDDNGNRKTGFVNQIDKYIEDVIGVEFTGWEGGIQQYIEQNSDAVYSHIDEILERAGQDFVDEQGRKWEGLSKSQVEDLRGYLLNIKGYVDEIEDVNLEFATTMQIIPQTIKGYSSLDDPTKDFLTQWINTLNISKDTSKADIEAMAQDVRDFTELLMSNDDLKLSVTAGIKLNSDATSEDITVEQYRQQIQAFIDSIKDFDEETQIKIKTTFGITDDGNEWENQVSQKVERVKNILQDEYDDAVSSLSMKELEIAYNISADTNSLTFDELKEKIDEIIINWGKFTDVLDFDPLADKLDGIGNSVSKLISSMKSLADGTALTHSELAKLALEYPKLLEASDLFTDGSIEGQQAMLDSILNVYEKQYDAAIDEKIAELEATQLALNEQLEIEKQKQQIVLDLKVAEANGQIETEEQLVEIINKFKNLEGQNYVTFKDGELQANTDYINSILDSEDALGEQTTDIWNQTNANIVSGYGSAGSAVIDASKQTAEKSLTFIQKIGNWFKKLGHAIKSLFSGDGWDFSLGDVELDGSTVVNTKDVLQNAWASNKTTIDDLSIGEWSDNQSKKISDRIDAIQSQIDTNLVIIDNLKKLKGLDLSSLYGSSSSSKKSSKEIEEYIADIDEYYAALKRLEDAQTLRENIENELKHTDDPAAKISLYDKLVDAYKEEAEAERNLINQRSRSIAANAAALRKLGFEVEYNDKTHKLYIKNLEHLNELTATSKGSYDSLQEATNALRKETEELINITEDLNDSNRDSIDNIEDIAYEIQDVAEDIIDCIEEVYQKQIDAYNDIIDKRKEAIQSAKDEYKYEEDVADKVKEIAELQAKIDKLSLDNSREAQAQRASLMEELKEKQKDLNETQSDHAYDAQVDALDKMAEEYEKEKNAELDILRESIGTVQDLGTVIDTRVTNAWKNAKKAVEEYGQSVAGLNGGVITNIGAVPKYHSGGVVGGNETGKEEVLALLEAGEIVLNDKKQDTIYRIIDFHSKLAERLGVDLGQTAAPLYSLDTTPNFGGTEPRVVTATAQTVFSPEFNIEINHNGEMSDDEARRYGSEIADTAIAKLYNAFERKGISNHNGAKLKP